MYASENTRVKVALVAVAYFILSIDSCGCIFAFDQHQCPRIMQKIFEQAAPIGGTSQCNMTINPGASDIKHCITTCCEQGSECNVVFMYNRSCYHVKCTTSQMCLPEPRENLSGHLSMVLVNPVLEDDPPWLKILKTANMDDLPELLEPQRPSYFKHYNREESQGQNLYNTGFTNTGKMLSNMFMDQANDVGPSSYGNENFINDDKDLDMEESKMYSDTKMLECSGSLDECPPHEQCMQIGSQLRQGICTCMDNYKRDASGKCIESPPESVDDVKKPITDTDKVPFKNLTVTVVSKNVRLPDKEVTLAAYTIPDEKSMGETYKFEWKLISQPSGITNGSMTDQTKDKIELTNLSEGLYRFKVVVTGKHVSGEAYANVTVEPEKRINKLPEVIIKPQHQIVRYPISAAILDGSASKDDDGIVVWHWDLVQGPIGYQPKLPETNTLQLTDLTAPGNYTFKLTITDTDNAQNSSTVNITVLKGTDYPPEANAGPDVIVYLPHNSVILNGSLSTDDRDIVSWEWTKDSNDDKKAVDMQNTRTPFLQLADLVEGIYQFTLKVTDASNQTNTASVHVFVKPPRNRPPIANAGMNMTINLPKTWCTLNATLSNDDVSISKYVWRQLSGPSVGVLANANASVANATGLTIGSYQFEVAVVDENNNTASDSIWVTVVQETNTPPVANGGGDQSVYLPVNVIIFNGSKSSDDLGIVNYTWTREANSLAIGTVINGSNKKPVLMLADVVAGRYIFRLTVADSQGLTNSDTVSVIVHPDPALLSMVELMLTMEATSLTETEVDSLEQKLALLLGDNMKLHVQELKVEQRTGEAIIIFYVEKQLPNEEKSTRVNGLEVEKLLIDKFWRDGSILGPTISGIRTSVCQNTCSSHGVCNPQSRACMCDTFWMPDIFYFWGVRQANCDWSILYVVIGVFVLFLLLSAMCWAITCMCRRAEPRPRAKPQKYALLGSHEEDMSAFSRNISISDSETDSDVLFESRTKPNGILRSNNSGRNGSQKIATTRLGRRIKT